MDNELPLASDGEGRWLITRREASLSFYEKDAIVWWSHRNLGELASRRKVPWRKHSSKDVNAIGKGREKRMRSETKRAQQIVSGEGD